MKFLSKGYVNIGAVEKSIYFGGRVSQAGLACGLNREEDGCRSTQDSGVLSAMA